MELLIDSFISAVALVISLDREMVDIVAVSLKVSCYSTLFASLLGIPLGFLVAFESFVGKRFVITCLNTLLAVPTVVIGLFVYAFISRRGVLGFFDLLYTQKAIIIGQTLLILPVVAAFTIAAISRIDQPEVGISMMLGGNIRSFTRTMTTAMALEYDKGAFTLAVALGIVLLGLSFGMNMLFHLFQGRVRS
jgi:tungstate transport system permease protein